MTRTGFGRELSVWIIAAVSACITVIALRGAIQWYDRPLPGVLVTADGTVSSIGMPDWSGIEQGLRFPDRVEAIDGVALRTRNGSFLADVWDRQVQLAADRGERAVHLRVTTDAGPRELDLRLERIDPASWWLYGPTMMFVGTLYALAAVIALASSPGSVVAATFAKSAFGAAVFSLTFFDAHTQRAMVPLFQASFAWIPFALAALALRLPDDVPLVRRFPVIPGLLDAGGIVLAAAAVVGGWHGMPATGLQTLCTILLGGTLLFFVAVLGARYFAASGTRRATLRVLFRATATPYALLGCGTCVTMLSSRGSTAAFFAIPALALAPVATGIAFVRHDLWGSRALISRVSTRSLAGVVACVVAMGIGAALAVSLGFHFQSALAGAAAGAIASVPLVYVVSRAVERRLFPAAAQYKPTIEQLSEDLTAITNPSDLAVAVERTVRRWLPCESVTFVPGADRAASPVPAEGTFPLNGASLWIPVLFGGRSLGSLRVGQKHGGALFTTDDLDLLRTIANQAALALAHANSYAELEERRQQQAAAWQIERVALVETVAAEIAHEVRYPINFFRSVFRRDPKNTPLDAEEIDIGCEEVDRLERLVSGLRRMVVHRIERRTVPIADLVARAEVLLRDALGSRALSVEVPVEAMLRCDPDQVTQVIVNLVANAIDATALHDRIGVSWASGPDGAELVVWDEGPGFDGDASRLFAPWFTTKVRGTGLGLAITQRIVRAHAWSIDAVRSDATTRFVVSIPSADVLHVQDSVTTAQARARVGVGGE